MANWVAKQEPCIKARAKEDQGDRGESYEYFVTTGGDAQKNDLMDGIVTDWKRIPGWRTN